MALKPKKVLEYKLIVGDKVYVGEPTYILGIVRYLQTSVVPQPEFEVQEVTARRITLRTLFKRARPS